MSPPAPLRLELFGAVRLLEDGAPMRVSLKRAHALLAYLALEGRPVPRDHLALLLWPEASQEIGRTRLRRLVYTVEEQCGRELFEAVGSTLALSAHALDCDVAEFRRIAHDLVGGGSPGITLRQLDEWAGRACEPLMEGLGFGSDEFDDWLSATRTSHQHLLQRTLSRLAQLHRARGASGAAVAACEQLIRMDAFAEPAYVLRMQLAADLHDVGGVESAFERCAQALRAEYGCKPSRETEAAYLRARELAAGPGTEAPSMQPPELDIRFAPGPQGSVAYALIGQGSEALVVMPGFISHIEIGWEHPGTRAVLGELARHFTVVVFDRRGLGLSERLEATGTAKAAAADVLTILDHASIRKAWLFGSSEGGPAAIELAAARPERVSGLLLFGAMAKGSRVPDYPWAMDAAAYNAWMNLLIAQWGQPASLQTFAPDLERDPATRAWWSRMLRHAATPASLRTLLCGLRDADVRPLLARLRLPTLVMHRRDDRAVRFGAGEHLAAAIPGSRFVPLEGNSHWWWTGDTAAVVREILAFSGH